MVLLCGPPLQGFQLVLEGRKRETPPVAEVPDQPGRVDYEYERAGTAAVFLFRKPLSGRR